MENDPNPEFGDAERLPGQAVAAPALAPATIHAACVALDGNGVLLTGPSGSGKSDLALRLLEAGFALVADDRVIVSEGGMAAPPDMLAGLLEIRGVGIVRLPWWGRPVPVRLHVALGADAGPRLPYGARHPATGALSIRLDARRAGAVPVIRAALACALGTMEMVAGLCDPVAEGTGRP